MPLTLEQFRKCVQRRSLKLAWSAGWLMFCGARGLVVHGAFQPFSKGHLRHRRSCVAPQFRERWPTWGRPERLA